MYEIDKARFGAFVAGLRREGGMTQKELAQRLFVSDKAVSKWERGLSMPDVALLAPLSELLGVTVTELLRGQRTQERETLEAGEVERLVSSAVRLSAGEQRVRARRRKGWRLAWVLCALAAAGEVALLLAMGFSWEEMGSTVLLVVMLCVLFGAWLCFLARESLPRYYDENKISFYGDGVFRMNLPGVHFNNSNWPHVLNAMRVWLLGTEVAFPPLWWAVHTLWPGHALIAELPLTLFACLGFFLPTYFAGKKYE